MTLSWQFQSVGIVWGPCHLPLVYTFIMLWFITKNCHAIFSTLQFKLINSHINNFWFEEKSYKSFEQIIDLGELKTTLHAHSFQALMFECLLKRAISKLCTAAVCFTGCSEENENVHVFKLQGLEQKAAMFVCTVNSTNKRQAWGLTHFLKSQTERLL